MELDLGFVVLNSRQFTLFFNQPASEVIIELLAAAGWLFLIYLLLYMGLFLTRMEYKSAKYTKNWQWVLLAIDMPALNVQTPKAVEQMFSHLSGAFDSPDIAHRYRHGYKQRWFSFEIISIEGYIQFLVRTEISFRDLVEASVYAQYPDAEIVEVEDYVNSVPKKFPNETHDMWAGDFVLSEKDCYPIRTYEEFEHSISKDTVLKDPMGTFLESFSRIGPGEQMWFQIIVEPISNSWKESSIKVISKLIGEKHAPSNTWADQLANAPVKFLESLGDEIFVREASEAKAAKDSGPKNFVQFLTPGQKTVVESIEKKISKIGFKTKMRGIYIATKASFQPARGVNALQGAIKQFNIPTANSIVPKFTTGSISYFFKKKRLVKRKNVQLQAYRKRKIKTGANPFIFNIEELATVWHFPMSHVKTPQVQKSQSKAAEPPSGLPMESLLEDVSLGEEKLARKKGYGIDAGPEYGDDQRFG
jgi:hypothetical protein